MPYPYEVTERPGCHGKPRNPVVSRHRTLEAAVRAARKSDRLQVESVDSSTPLYAPPRRDHPRYGAGCYGQPARRGEPTVAEAVREARKIEASL